VLRINLLELRIWGTHRAVLRGDLLELRMRRPTGRAVRWRRLECRMWRRAVRDRMWRRGFFVVMFRGRAPGRQQKRKHRGKSEYASHGVPSFYTIREVSG
jgi:hypothetical protein